MGRDREEGEEGGGRGEGGVIESGRFFERLK